MMYTVLNFAWKVVFEYIRKHPLRKYFLNLLAHTTAKKRLLSVVLKLIVCSLAPS